MTTVISGSSPSITFSDATTQSTTAPSTSTFGFKNRIINGGMVIDQRNAGAAIASPSDNYTTDRFYSRQVGGGVASVQQSSTAPAGFTNSLLYTVTTPDSSIVTTDRYYVAQYIEGYNIADLGWGTASAKTVTLSFWVYSSLFGTFGGSLRNGGGTRSYPFTYTTSSANTWTQVSVTIVGDTSGTWLTTNGIGVAVFFSLGMGPTYSGTASAWASGDYLSATGATNVIATNGATFYITGVQLEVGTQATSFDFRDYGRELMLCQRYYFKNLSSVTSNSTGGVGAFANSTTLQAMVQFPVAMRTAPTFTQSGCNLANGVAGSAVTSVGTSYFGNYGAQLTLVASGGTFVASTAGYVYDGASGTGYTAYTTEF